MLYWIIGAVCAAIGVVMLLFTEKIWQHSSVRLADTTEESKARYLSTMKTKGALYIVLGIVIVCLQYIL